MNNKSIIKIDICAKAAGYIGIHRRSIATFVRNVFEGMITTAATLENASGGEITLFFAVSSSFPSSQEWQLLDRLALLWLKVV